MKIGIMQPYFLPYIGYFQLINSVDKFVIYDDVQFIKGGWINRNKTLVNKDSYTLLLKIKKDKYDLNINQRYFTDDFNLRAKKMLTGIETTYKKAPFYDDVIVVLHSIFNYNHNSNIAEFICNSIMEVCSYLDIKKEILISSQLQKNNDLKNQERVIDIVKTLKGDEYINPIGGLNLYSSERFERDEIKLRFLKTNDIRYMQFGDEFVPNLSILDVLMFNSKEEVRKLLMDYTLITN